MKQLQPKTIILVFIIANFFANAQTDTLVTLSKKIIPCTITYVNESAIFYKDKKGFGDEILIKQIDKYYHSGKLIKVNIPIDTSANALFVDNVNINNLDIKYCELSGFDLGLFRSNLIIYVDYGQFISNPQDISLKNSKGQIMKFNSMIDALNFMEKNGWEYINQSVNTGVTSLFGKNGALYKYLLKKK